MKRYATAILVFCVVVAFAGAQSLFESAVSGADDGTTDGAGTTERDGTASGDSEACVTGDTGAAKSGTAGSVGTDAIAGSSGESDGTSGSTAATTGQADTAMSALVPASPISGYLESRLFSNADFDALPRTDAQIVTEFEAAPADWIEAYGEITASGGIARRLVTGDVAVTDAWVQLTPGPLAIKVGHTILGWGKTDGISPTDMVNARTPSREALELDDQKDARPLVSLTGTFGPARAQAVLLPTAAFSQNPLMSAGATSGSVIGGQTGGTDSTNGTILPTFPIELPGGTLELQPAGLPTSDDVGVAARLALDLPALSVSLVGGYGPAPETGLTILTPPDEISFDSPVAVSPVIHRRLIIGANLETVALSTVIRIDGAYRYPDANTADPGVPNPETVYAGALERTIGATWTVTGQYYGRYVQDWVDPLTAGSQPSGGTPPSDPAILAAGAVSNLNNLIFNQTEEVQHGVLGRVSAKLAYQTLQVSLLGQYNITTEEYLLQPRLEYDLADGAEVIAGLTWADGPDRTRFSHAHDNLSGAFVVTRVYF